MRRNDNAVAHKKENCKQYRCHVCSENVGPIRVAVRRNKTKLPPNMKSDCGEGSNLLACPKDDVHQEQEDVLTDDIDQQAQAVKNAEDDKKRRDKQLQTDKAKLQIAKGNERLRALAGIKSE